MKTTNLFISVLAFIPVIASAQKGIVDSFRPAAPIVIDGKMDDWDAEWLADSKGKFAYNVANDDDFIYYRVKIVDDLTQRKIGYFGLTTLLNPSGKKPGKVGLKFPMSKDMQEIKNQKGPQGPVTNDVINQVNRDLIKDAEALELIGLAKQNIVSSRLGLMNGIQVIIVADENGDYIYEGKIPFKAFKLKKASIKTLGVAFQTGKLPRSTIPVNPNNTSGFANGSAYNRSAYGSNQQRTMYVPYNEYNVPTTMAVGVILK